MYRKLILLPALFIALSTGVFGQAGHSLPGVEFVTPRPNAEFVPPETGLTIRGLGEISIDEPSDVTITGTRSGPLRWHARQASDGASWLITPAAPFLPGETITVDLSAACAPAAVPLSWSFHISSSRSPLESTSFANASVPMASPKRDLSGAETAELPTDFPVYLISGSVPATDESLFLAPFGYLGGGGQPYLLILGFDGEPIFYRRLHAPAFDFKRQPNGNLTWFDNHPDVRHFIEIDSTYTEVDRWAMKNGYVTDGHELLLLETGGAILMAYDPQPVDMSQIVPGGRPDATVIGLIIQELDSNHNVIFEWRSWDHFEVTDAASRYDLRQQVVDFAHGNSIGIDHDGDLLVSSRNLHEVTRIDRQTGDIVWRWGGDMNEFEFLGNSVPFSHQHDARRLPNNNILLFDNGNAHDPPFSRAVEYRLDEVSMTAEPVWEWRGDPARFSVAMGSARRGDDGSTLIGWGLPTDPDQSRIASLIVDDTLAWELSMPPSNASYRALRYPWSGKSRVPYLYSEDPLAEKRDAITLKMTMFGDVEPTGYVVYYSETEEDSSFDSIATIGPEGRYTATGLRRGATHRFRSAGILTAEQLTPRSETLLYEAWPEGPILRSYFVLDIDPVTRGSSIQTRWGAPIHNDGEDSLIVGEITIRGIDGDLFRVVEPTRLPIAVPPDSVLPLAIEFGPADVPRRYTATLTLRSNAVNDTARRIALSATAVAADLAAVSDTIDFDTVAVGSSRDTLVTGLICNDGIAAVEIIDLAIDAPGFEARVPGSLPATLAPDSCLEVALRFVPTDTGAHFGTVRVVIRSGDTSDVVHLTGRGGQLISVDRPALGSLEVIVAPNPATSDLTVFIATTTDETVDCEVIDAVGKSVVRSTGLPVSGRYHARLGLTNRGGQRLLSGVYHLVVRQGAEILRVPVVILPH